MSRRKRKSEARALIHRLEEGSAPGIKSLRIVKNLINMSTGPSTDIFDFLNRIRNEGGRVLKTTMDLASSYPAASLSSRFQSSRNSASSYSRSSSLPAASYSRSFNWNTSAIDANSFDEIDSCELSLMSSVRIRHLMTAPEPKLLCIVADRPAKMATSWAAVKYSVRGEIAAAKIEGTVRTSITVIDESILDLVQFNKAVKGIPDYVGIGSGCAIMDALAFQIEAALDYSRANPKYARNIELLVYTKGLDTASTRIVSMEKLAKVIDAAASIGFNIRIMDPSASNVLGRLELCVDRVTHRNAGPITQLLSDLKLKK